MLDAEQHALLIANLLAEVDEQINDEGLWFAATTAPEAYLQAELRRLHRVIEAYARTCAGEFAVVEVTSSDKEQSP